MALTSPRFTNCPQLTAAASNSPWLGSGSKGHGVHLVQAALIDLGYDMPKSVGGKRMSPDGSYGSETVAKVKEFQASALGGPAVTDDGAVGANTLAKLERAIGGYKHKITLQILTTKQSDIPLGQMVSTAQEVYGHYGIKVEVQMGKSVTLTPAEQAIVDDPNASRRDVREIIIRHSAMRPGPTHINVLQVGVFPDDYGNSAFGPLGAMAFTGKDATPSTLAHEIGHILLKSVVGVDDTDHSTYPNDVMTKVQARKPFVFRIEHIKEMRTAARCQTI